MRSWGRWWRREEGGEMILGRGEKEREKKKMKNDEEEAQWLSELKGRTILQHYQQ